MNSHFKLESVSHLHTSELTLNLFIRIQQIRINYIFRPINQLKSRLNRAARNIYFI